MKSKRDKRFVVSVTEYLGENLQEIMARSTTLKRRRSAFVELDVCERPVAVIMSTEFKKLIEGVLATKLELVK